MARQHDRHCDQRARSVRHHRPGRSAAGRLSRQPESGGRLPRPQPRRLRACVREHLLGEPGDTQCVTAGKSVLLICTCGEIGCQAVAVRIRSDGRTSSGATQRTPTSRGHMPPSARRGSIGASTYAPSAGWKQSSTRQRPTLPSADGDPAALGRPPRAAGCRISAEPIGVSRRAAYRRERAAGLLVAFLIVVVLAFSAGRWSALRGRVLEGAPPAPSASASGPPLPPPKRRPVGGGGPTRPSPQGTTPTAASAGPGRGGAGAARPRLARRYGR